MSDDAKIMALLAILAIGAAVALYSQLFRSAAAARERQAWRDRLDQKQIVIDRLRRKLDRLRKGPA